MKNTIIPTVIQDYKTLEIYMVGFSNDESIKKTRQSGWVYFWSRSKNRLWMKGEESGNKLKVKEFYVDCDNDTLLLKVELIGKNVCHTGKISCFFKKINNYDA